MKTFLKNTILYALLVTIISLILCVAIDPFNVFHKYNVRYTGVEPDKNYIKMSNIIKNPDRFDSYLFGSSRVGNFHVENIEGVSCYNMTYASGAPSEFLDNINTMLSHGIIPKNIYLAVDDFSYMDNPEEHNDLLYGTSYEYAKAHPVKFYSRLLNPATIGNALISTMLLKEDPNFDFNYVFHNYGWNHDYGFVPYDQLSESRDDVLSYFYTVASSVDSLDIYDVSPFARKDETLDDIRKIVDICNEYDINLIIFTNPLRYDFYTTAVTQYRYLNFLVELSEVTPYYNFSGFNNVSIDSSYYYDESHYGAEASDLILDCIFRDTVDNELLSQGFGMYVTKDTVGDLVELLMKKEPGF